MIAKVPNITVETKIWPWPDASCSSGLAHGIEHRFTKPNYPWANDQVETMNRTLK